MSQSGPWIVVAEPAWYCDDLINLIGVVGAVALASGLAFGLGGREMAGEIVRGWQDQARHAAPQMVRAAENIKHQAGDRLPATR